MIPGRAAAMALDLRLGAISSRACASSHQKELQLDYGPVGPGRGAVTAEGSGSLLQHALGAPKPLTAVAPVEAAKKQGVYQSDPRREVTILHVPFDHCGGLFGDGTAERPVPSSESGRT